MQNEKAFVCVSSASPAGVEERPPAQLQHQLQGVRPRDQTLQRVASRARVGHAGRLKLRREELEALH